MLSMEEINWLFSIVLRIDPRLLGLHLPLHPSYRNTLAVLKPKQGADSRLVMELNPERTLKSSHPDFAHKVRQTEDK